MYNNEVTYHKKWETDENRRWQRKAAKLCARSSLYASIPLAWSKEIYELVKDIDDKFGIRYDLTTYNSYRIDYKTLPKQLFYYPVKEFFSTVKSLWKDAFNPSKHAARRHPTVLSRWKYTLFGGRHSYLGGWYILFRFVRGSIYNWWRKPQVSMTQMKEKYGYLTIYWSAPNWIENYIDEQETNAVIKLIKKGAYYPADYFYYAYSSWYDREHSYQTKRGSFVDSDGNKIRYTDTKYYSYRKALKDAGFDLAKLKRIADKRRREDARRQKSKTSNSGKKRP